MAKKIRGITFEETLKNTMGLAFYDLSHPFGLQKPNWPYFRDVQIDRIHDMAKSGVRSQRIATGMHHGTDIICEDSEDYFCRTPGFVPSAGKWFVEKKGSYRIEKGRKF